MTKEQAIKGLKENLCSLCAYGSQNMDCCDIRECDNRDYIKALEQQSSDDCVSRQAMLDAITEIDGNINMDIYTNEVREIVKALSSVTHTLPKGATNGDMIKAVFPYINDKPNKVQDNGNRIVIYIDMGFGWRTIEFEKDWWNSPYKRGNENGSN